MNRSLFQRFYDCCDVSPSAVCLRAWPASKTSWVWPRSPDWSREKSVLSGRVLLYLMSWWFPLISWFPSKSSIFFCFRPFHFCIVLVHGVKDELLKMVKNNQNDLFDFTLWFPGERIWLQSVALKVKMLGVENRPAYTQIQASCILLCNYFTFFDDLF